MSDSDEAGRKDVRHSPTPSLEEFMDEDSYFHGMTGEDVELQGSNRISSAWYNFFDRDENMSASSSEVVDEAARRVEIEPEAGMFESSVDEQELSRYEDRLAARIWKRAREVEEAPAEGLGGYVEALKWVGTHSGSKSVGTVAGGAAGYLFADHIQDPEFMTVPALGLGLLSIIGTLHGLHSAAEARRRLEKKEELSEALEEAYTDVCEGKYDTAALNQYRKRDPLWSDYRFQQQYVEDDMVVSETPTRLPSPGWAMSTGAEKVSGALSYTKDYFDSSLSYTKDYLDSSL